MIENLKKTFVENGFSEISIEKILKKKLTQILVKRLKEIEKIFKVLNDNGIRKEAIEGCLILLAHGKADEIEKIFDDKYVDNDRSKHIINVKKYMKLKQLYNRSFSKGEIEELCKIKKISLYEFIKYIMLKDNSNEDMIHLYLNILEKQKLYIGQSKKIEDQEYLEDNAELFFQLVGRITEKFCRINNCFYCKDDLESFAITVIVFKCGDLVENLINYPDILNACIFKRVYKYLYGEKMKLDLQGRNIFNYAKR